MKLLELSFPLLLGSALTLVATLLTSKQSQKHQSKEASKRREFDALESRRLKAASQADELLESLTALQQTRRSLYQQSWVDAGPVDTSKLDALTRVIPDKTVREALSEIRFPLTLGIDIMGYLPDKYGYAWITERAAIADAIETVATYIRGDEVTDDLLQKQLDRNEACKKALDEFWADPDLQHLISKG